MATIKKIRGLYRQYHKNVSKKQMIVYPYCMLRALWLSKRFGFKCILGVNPALKINIHLGKNARIITSHAVHFTRFFYNDLPINIILHDNAILKINGDVLIGSGTLINVAEGAYLEVGGSHQTTEEAAILGSNYFCAKKNNHWKRLPHYKGCIYN